MKIVILCVLAIVVLLAEAQHRYENTFDIPVEHSFDGVHFEPRGVISLTSSRGGGFDNAQFSQTTPLTGQQQQALLTSAKADDLYFVRVPGKLDGKHVGDDFAMSCTKTCLLVHSELSDYLLLSVDSARSRILSVTVQPADNRKHCSLSHIQDSSFVQQLFNTTVYVSDVVEGPTPETQAFLQKIEKERKEKEKGETLDNRSFLAKYWMYIVPVVLFLVFSNAMNPEAAGQGR